MYHYCFTCWNTESFSTRLSQMELVSYMIAGLEICPKTGKEHIQGYLQSSKRLSFPTIKKILDEKTAHIEVANGSSADNIEYCSKDKKTFIYGQSQQVTAKRKRQGERTDWNQLRDDIKLGKDDAAIAESNPGLFVRNGRGIQQLRRVLAPVPKEFKKKHIIYVWGPPGSGKTRFAHSMDPNAYVLPYSRNTPWWTDYEGQKTVIMDDVQPASYTRGELLTWLDGYPTRVHTAMGGSARYLEADTIILTSNYPPEEIGDSAFIRRICLVVQYYPRGTSQEID